MSSTGKPITYLALRSLLPYVDANKSIVNSEIQIDETSYKFNSVAKEKTKFIQIRVNNQPVQLVATKTQAKKVMKGFLEKVFSGRRSVNIGFLKFGFCPISNIQLTVEHLLVTKRFFEPVVENILSRNSLPLKSVEIEDWNGATEHSIKNADKLIACDDFGEYSRMLNVPNSRVHFKFLNCNQRQAPMFLTWMVKRWLQNAIVTEKHWSFDISSDMYTEFMNFIHRLETPIMEIRNGECLLSCPRNPTTTVRIYSIPNPSDTGKIELNVKFESRTE